MIKTTTTRENIKPATLKRVCDNLYAWRRHRNMHTKSRIAMHNRTLMQIATLNGYASGLEEKDRKKMMKEAAECWEQIVAGEVTHPLQTMVKVQDVAMREIQSQERKLARLMGKELSKLPWIVEWLDHNDRRGLSAEGLALIIGETGDLYNYDNVAKLHRRMSVAPYYCKRLDRTHMGSTWKRLKLLKAEEWTEYGYVPRRRAMMYVAEGNLLKANFVGDPKDKVDGHYRRIYQHAKEVKMVKWASDTNKSNGKNNHAHKHAMLVMGRAMLADAWAVWTGSTFVPWPQREVMLRERAAQRLLQEAL